MPDIKGLIVPVITPRYNGDIDLDGLENLIEYLIDDVDGIFVLGMTGEFCNLTIRQKKAVIRQSIGIVDYRVPLLIGVTSENLMETMHLIDYSSGADGLVLVPCFSREITENIDDLVYNSELPIVLYNNPELTGQNIPVEFIRRLITKKKVIGIKDSSGDMDYFKELLNLQSRGFCVFQGDESLIEESREFADGAVSGGSNTIPGPFRRIFYGEETQDDLRRINHQHRVFKPEYVANLKQSLYEKEIIRSPEMWD